jgi:nickel-dependent lactate racemase
MPIVQLRYGKTQIPLAYDENQFQVLGAEQPVVSLNDAEIGERFDNPIDSKPLEEIISHREKVLLVVPDATRQTACASIVNLLVRRLIANGTMPHEIKIIFATGIHRSVSDEEKRELLTPFIFQRIGTIDHRAKDLMQIAGLKSNLFADFGTTRSGIPVRLNRALIEFDHIIIIGGITFHYFAGFTGGRKLICPGLASAETISETHRLAFDFQRKTRRAGVGTAILEGNAVHEAFMEIAEKVSPSFSINTIVNDRGEAAEVFGGHWKTAHQQGCRFYAEKNTIKIREKRDFVIVSCGGFPFDLNMIQAHKALEAASQACAEGGTIVLLAQCADGLGRDDFLKWFSAESSAELAENLCENYQVNGQTAWSLLQKAEKFKIKILTDLPAEQTRQMRLQKVFSIDEVLPDKKLKGYILPFGAKYFVKSYSD